MAARMTSCWRIPRRRGTAASPARLPSSKPPPLVIITLQGAQAVVTTRQKAMSSASSVVLAPTGTDAATQTELPREHAAIQVSGCRVCLRFLLVSEGSSENSCGRCTQVEELLSLVAELREEVYRLRSIQESEKEIDWWNHTLPSLEQKCQLGITHDKGGSCTLSPQGRRQ